MQFYKQFENILMNRNNDNNSAIKVILVHIQSNLTHPSPHCACY